MSTVYPPHGPAGPAVEAAAIIPGPDWTLTFVLCARGPQAGHWTLPGGRTGPGESAEQAARRASEQAAGVRPGAMAPTGLYEVRGGDDDSGYHLHLHVFRALQPCEVPEGFAAAPDAAEGVGQVHPRDVLPHPAHMRVLNDAGLADYDEALVRRLMLADGMLMRRLDGDLPPG